MIWDWDLIFVLTATKRRTQPIGGPVHSAPATALRKQSLPFNKMSFHLRMPRHTFDLPDHRHRASSLGSSLPLLLPPICFPPTLPMDFLFLPRFFSSPAPSGQGGRWLQESMEQIGNLLSLPDKHKVKKQNKKKMTYILLKSWNAATSTIGHGLNRFHSCHGVHDGFHLQYGPTLDNRPPPLFCRTVKKNQTAFQHI